MAMQFSLYIMALFYIAAGINHFANPAFYFRMMPTWLPMPILINQLSGAFEAVLGLLLLLDVTRPYAAWGIIVLLILIFPANIQMSLNYWYGKSPLFWLSLLRLPFQAGFIWWAWLYTK